LLKALAQKGVKRAELLLHVGAGTFKPVEAEDPADHVMHEEWYDLPARSARELNAAREGGHRICAVGTTALRTHEPVGATAADEPAPREGQGPWFRAASGETRIFIRPPHWPAAADMLVTNFHLPRSTLLMLVAAFAGYDLAMEAYRVALAHDYRFYSYGDAMLVR
jgi:S-adenosylmethionine:tRNA ribosyltransferase-isomerase